MIRTRGLTRVFGRGGAPTVALKDVDLDIGGHGSVAIQGPSGGGKSTLLSILGLLDEPTSGQVWLQEHRVDQLSARQKRLLRNRQIGWIFQNFNLVGTMNALHNVILPLRFNPDVDARDRGRLGRQALERVGLADKAHALPQELSGGQQQRVAIARALVAGPRLVLADEPTGNLDSATSEQIMTLLLDQVAEGATLIVVTHDAGVAARCDRRLEIHDGQVSSAGGHAG